MFNKNSISAPALRAIFHGIILIMSLAPCWASEAEVKAFGDNFYGALGDGATINSSAPISVPIGGVQSVAAGYGFTFFVKTDGSLWATGNNSSGQLGDGTTTNRSTPVLIVSSGVKAVAAGSGHTMILKTDGSLWATGSNWAGQLGDGTTTDRVTPVRIFASGVQAVAAGGSHTMVLKMDGSLWATGDNFAGGLGDGTITSRSVPVQIIPSGVQAVAAGYNYTMILYANGFLFATGANNIGQLGVYLGGSSSYSNVPVIVTSGVRSIAVGVDHTMIVKEDGSLWATGDNGYGQYGDGTRNGWIGFVKVLASGVQGVATGFDHTMILKTDGSLWATGYNRDGELGDGTTTDRSEPALIIASGVQQVSAGAHHTVAVMKKYTIEYNSFGGAGTIAPGTKLHGVNLTLSDGVGLSRTGLRFTGWNSAPDGNGTSYGKNAIYVDNANLTLYAQWTIDSSVTYDVLATGRNGFGQLGDGTTANKSTPVQILDSGVQEVSAGYHHTMVLTANGSLWATGSNSSGQLGDGTTTDRASPELIIAAGVQSVGSGGYHTAIIKNDGSLWTTGWNGWGQLGDGTSINRTTPVKIISSSVRSVAVGYKHTMILKSDGSLWAVGGNDDGQFGDGTTATHFAPIQIFDAGVQAVAAGYNHTLILKIDGSLWAAGGNDAGQLGDGTTAGRLTPVRIFASGVQAVSAGYKFSMILKSDGSLWGSGSNAYYQLGYSSSSSDQSTPVQIVSADVQAVAAGGYHTLILKRNGSLWAMGWNGEGQYGNGTSISAIPPVQIIASGGQALSAGFFHSTWVTKRYPISYDANGGTGSISTVIKSLAVGVTLSDGSGFTRTGYTFFNWNTATDGSGTGYAPGSAYTTDAAVTCYAQWVPTTFIVNYQANGATSGSVPVNQTITYSIPLTLATNGGSLVKTGSIFTGWNTRADGLGTDYAPGSSATVDASLILYAKWQAATFTVSYRANGATSGTLPVNQTKTYGVPLTLATNAGNLAKAGSVFVGWNTQADGLGTDYAPGSSTTVDVSQVLYAKWQLATFTVSYRANGATSGTAPANQTKAYGVPLTLATNTGALLKTGSVFVGWNTQANGLGTDYVPGSNTTVNANQTLYAQWQVATFAVRYQANGATSGTAPANQVKVYGVTLMLATNPGSLAKTGGTWVGWNTQSDGLGADYVPGSSTTVEADQILYAKWQVATFTVNYQSNGATSGSAPDNQTKTYGVPLTLATNAGSLAKAGSVFAGWNTRADGLGAAYAAGGSVGVEDNLTLYAQWLEIPIINSPMEVTGNLTAAFSYQITASNLPTEFHASGLPSGLALNTATGLISGIPTVAGTFTVAIEAANAAGTGTATLAISVVTSGPTTSVSGGGSGGGGGCGLGGGIAVCLAGMGLISRRRRGLFGYRR